MKQKNSIRTKRMMSVFVLLMMLLSVLITLNATAYPFNETTVDTKLDATSTNIGRHLVHDPGRHIVYASYTKTISGKTQVLVARSFDNGSTWTNTTISTPLYNQFFPGIAIDSNGYLYLVWEGYMDGTTYTEIRFSKSTDQGVTWSAPVNLSSTVYDQNRPTIAVDAYDKLHVAWFGYNDGGTRRDIQYINSTDQGTTWSAKRNMSFDAYSGNSVDPTITCDYDNRLFLFYNQIRNPRIASDIMLRTSTNSGLTWSNPINITNLKTDNNQNSPITTVLRDGSVHLAWERIWGTNYFVGYSKSTNNGTTWTTPVNLTSDTGLTLISVYISSDYNNKLHIVTDQLNNSSPTRFQLHYINSTDQGTTWSSKTNFSTNDAIRKWYFNLMDSTYPITYGYSWSKPIRGFAGFYNTNYTNLPSSFFGNFTKYTGYTIHRVTPPAGTTNTSTGVQSTNATLRGYVTTNGNDTVECQFQYGHTTSYGTTTANQTKTKGQTFSFENTQHIDETNIHTRLGQNLVFESYIKAMTFTVGTNGSNVSDFVDRVSINIQRVGVAGTLYILLREVNATGMPLETNLSSTAIPYTSVSTTAGVQTFTIQKTELHKGTKYALCFYSPGSDAIKQYALGTDGWNFYHGGSPVISSNAGHTWAAYGVTDYIFRVYNSTTTLYTPGMLYHYRAVFHNLNGTAYGTDKTFITIPNTPTSATEHLVGTTIRLTWTKGTGANNTIIERNTIATWDMGNGTEIYNGTGTTYDDTTFPYNNETGVINVYYQYWSYTVWGANQEYSDSTINNFHTTTPTSFYVEEILLPLVIGVILFAVLIGMLFTGHLDLKFLIGWLVLAVISISVLQVIFSL